MVEHLPSKTTPRRPRAQTTPVYPIPVDQPWKHMAQTYTWVVEQEQEKLQRQNKKTEKWVVAQQDYLPDRSRQKTQKTIESPRRTLEELRTGYDAGAEMRKGQERVVQRSAVEREREKTRVVDEDIKRIQARVQKKKEQERQFLAEQRARASEAQRERERQENARANVASVDAWRVHEARWARLAEGSEPLTFRTIPWPLVSRPSDAVGIIPAGIIAFLLSPLHSQGQSRKDRIRAALLRWHPDRFQKYLGRVVEKDRGPVMDGVGIVVRCLNELMERETRVIRGKCYSPTHIHMTDTIPY